MNKVALIGRLVRDLELKTTNNGLAYCKFTLAVNRQFKKGEADFVNCVAWKGTAENLAKYCGKGSQIGVVGNIQTGSYKKDGRTIYTTEVVAEQIEFLGTKKENQNNNNYQANSTNNDNVSPNDFWENPTDNDDIDDMPF